MTEQEKLARDIIRKGAEEPMAYDIANMVLRDYMPRPKVDEDEVEWIVETIYQSLGGDVHRCNFGGAAHTIAEHFSAKRETAKSVYTVEWAESGKTCSINGDWNIKCFMTKQDAKNCLENEAFSAGVDDSELCIVEWQRVEGTKREGVEVKMRDAAGNRLEQECPGFEAVFETNWCKHCDGHRDSQDHRRQQLQQAPESHEIIRLREENVRLKKALNSIWATCSDCLSDREVVNRVSSLAEKAGER